MSSIRSELAQRLASLNDELSAAGVEAELCLVGGAVVTLAFDASPGTRRVTAMFAPTEAVTRAAARVAADRGLGPTWLSEAARGYVAPVPDDPSPFVELSHLRVFAAQPTYAFAMKCAALRVDSEPRDFDDLRYLLRFMNVHSAEDAQRLLRPYFNERQLPEDIEETLEGLLAPWPA